MTPDILTSLGLADLTAALDFARGRHGTFARGPAGSQVVLATADLVRSLHHVLERERPGCWRLTLKGCGHAAGTQMAAALDAMLASRGQAALAALPLEACLALLEQQFTAHGWGRLQIDLSNAAQHALVVARLEHSFFAAALSDSREFADAGVAGVLQGFFEYITGQALACEELACAAHGAAECTFAVAAPERLALVTPRLGHETAEALINRLTQP